ncbi:MAG TPA: DUF2807 domain-containing protein [Bacteroidota bacterium]|nr:DUF2807 domain-containing protein [Bacteroidota bacterium]
MAPHVNFFERVGLVECAVRRLVVLFIACLIVSVSSCDDDGSIEPDKPTLWGDGVLVRDSLIGVYFDKVMIEDGCRSRLSQDSAFTSRVLIDNNIKNGYLTYVILKSSLLIQLDVIDQNIIPTRFEAEITCPELRQISVGTSSSCDFSSGLILSDELYLTCIRGSTLGKLSAPSLRMVAAECSVRLHGNVPELQIRNRAGNLLLSDLEARHVEIDCEQFSKIEVHCYDTLRVKARTNSRIRYKGNPRALILDLDSTSTVERF